MFLSEIKAVCDVTLTKVNGGKGIKSKLYAMGIFPGIEMKVIKNDFIGPVIIAINDNRYVLGSGMSSKIEVEKI